MTHILQRLRNGDHLAMREAADLIVQLRGALERTAIKMRDAARREKKALAEIDRLRRMERGGKHDS